MAITLDPSAPAWARSLVSQLDNIFLRITNRTDGPFRLPSFTVSTLPTASKWAQCLIYVSNGTTNKRLAVSDGTNWRFPDGNIVS